MDKNLFLAIFLSLAVYIGWTLLFRPPSPESAAGKASAPQSSAAASPAPAGTAEGPLPAAPPAAAVPSLEKILPEARIIVAAQGARISSFQFPDVLGSIELLHGKNPSFLSTWDDLSFRLLSDEPSRSRFSAAHPSGIRLEKTFAWNADGVHGLSVTATNPLGSAVELPAWSIYSSQGLDTVASEHKENKSLLRAIALYRHPLKSEKSVFKKLSPGAYQENWRWVAVDNRYFLAAIMPPPQSLSGVEVLETQYDGHEEPQIRLDIAKTALQPHASKTWEFKFYIGPKRYHSLKSQDIGLEQAVDFGFFNAIGRVAFLALLKLHSVCGNFGWAIIALTILLQLLTLPLTLKSSRSMLALKKLQPKIQAVQTKFKDDPNRMNVEMMQLYKTSGTNPLGGCLPILLQIPIFYALFTTLRNAWDLHGAPFVLWIKDLSAHDPYYILPIAMGAVMFIQQKANPAAGDPMQAKMMMWMPVIFTFMFLNFPAGLVLYWLTSSVINLGQQLILQRSAQEE